MRLRGCKRRLISPKGIIGRNNFVVGPPMPRLFSHVYDCFSVASYVTLLVCWIAFAQLCLAQLLCMSVFVALF